MNLEQIALEVRLSMLRDFNGLSRDVNLNVSNETEFLRRCLAKLAALDVEPVAWWVPKAEQFAIMDKPKTRPFAKAFEPLFTKAQLLAVQQRTAEACAKVCEANYTTHYPRSVFDEGFSTATAVCAKAIRERMAK